MKIPRPIYNKVIAIIIILGCIPLDSIAQEDSISADRSHDLSIKSFIVPTATFGACALLANDKWFSGAREDMQDALSSKGRHRIKADDYLRFAPLAALPVLKMTNIKSVHNGKEMLKIRIISTMTMITLTEGMKRVFNERRPDGSDNKSFPSGHTATAFVGADFLYREYRDSAPWVGYTGYAVAALTGCLRIYNNKHWVNDVVAGACVGIISNKFAYWAYPRIFKKSDCGNRVQLIGLPYYDGRQGGVSMSMVF